MSAIEYVFTTEVPDFLRQANLSLLVTTYQAQYVMAMFPTEHGMTITMRFFHRPTGMALGPKELAVCSRRQVWFFRDTGTLRNEQGEALPHQVIFSPRRSHVTGDIAAHDAAYVGDELVIVNTRFSCLCTLTPEYSFVPGWRPPFVSALAAEDRCHLNGLAVDESGPRYVTALGETDTPQGWRENRAGGGIVMDVRSGDVVARGLAMPHSPRLHRGDLFVLDSGRAELVRVGSGPIARFEGYLRGLALHDRYAFVGLCKAREGREFGGLPVDAMRDRLRCAVAILDLQAGREIGRIEFTKGVEELFDVKVLPGVLRPHLIGMEDETVDGVFVIPQ